VTTVASGRPVFDEASKAPAASAAVSGAAEFDGTNGESQVALIEDGAAIPAGGSGKAEGSEGAIRSVPLNQAQILKADRIAGGDVEDAGTVVSRDGDRVCEGGRIDGEVLVDDELSAGEGDGLVVEPGVEIDRIACGGSSDLVAQRTGARVVRVEDGSGLRGDAGDEDAEKERNPGEAKESQPMLHHPLG